MDARPFLKAPNRVQRSNPKRCSVNRNTIPKRTSKTFLHRPSKSSLYRSKKHALAAYGSACGLSPFEDRKATARAAICPVTSLSSTVPRNPRRVDALGSGFAHARVACDTRCCAPRITREKKQWHVGGNPPRPLAGLGPSRQQPMGGLCLGWRFRRLERGLRWASRRPTQGR